MMGELSGTQTHGEYMPPQTPSNQGEQGVQPTATPQPQPSPQAQVIASPFSQPAAISPTTYQQQAIANPYSRIQPTPVVHSAIQPIALSQAPNNMIVARFRSVWKPIFRLSMLSIICSLLAQALVMLPFGFFAGEAVLSLLGVFCSLPLLLIFVLMRRPKLAHIIIAEPNPAGSYMHPLTKSRTLQTTVPTKIRRHLIRDSGVFDIPPTKVLWLIFAIGIVTSIVLAISLSSGNDGLMSIGIILSIFLGIPLLFIGFSVPVFAWWSFSSRKLGMMTRQHEAEAALTAGMLSTIPAIMINSIFFPMLLSFGGIIDDWTMMEFSGTDLATFLTLTISAPVGEELCKAAAVLLCARYIDSPRRGFQVGFTVGLGFAIVENFIYILGSFGGGWVMFSLTALLRGIGSIPGHALWTGLSGLAIGWLLYQNKDLSDAVNEVLGGERLSPSHELSLLDPHTGMPVKDATGQIVSDATQIIPANNHLQSWNTQHKMQVANDSKKMPLPREVWMGLGIAMLGHATWNGSSFLIAFLAESIGFGETGIILTELVWLFVLVGTSLVIGWHILKAVSQEPHHHEP
ncbi:MAG: PrsW family intramembrane metalloprotease [Euryarchaeota archaeon]|jgi:RsiW-degrading membrane proteinase PrsW (M82 family)|nr:PrsW family intramembrane metalloprotease [Euryarchaeota archaeon]MBT4407513.1 PrsW family intramembrane metalloprotease [Euryarchaeota archaeon]